MKNAFCLLCLVIINSSVNVLYKIWQPTNLITEVQVVFPWTDLSIWLNYLCSIQACFEVYFSLVIPGSSIKEFVHRALVIQMKEIKEVQENRGVSLYCCSLKICSQNILWSSSYEIHLNEFNTNYQFIQCCCIVGTYDCRKRNFRCSILC